MSGRGSGGGSGRAHFRSSAGCCICGTKSSSSRFTASQRYAEHFVACFGSSAAQRSGDLCNACVLCVKRWIQRGKRPGLFVQVLDSKRGPGPKHMKEITKRARRREARAAASQLSQLSCSSTTAKLPSLALRQQQQQQQQQQQHHHHHHHHHQSGTACHSGRWAGLGCAVGIGICVAGDGVCPQSASAGGSRCCLPSSPASQSHTEGATMTRAAAARQLEAANALAAADSLADFYGSPQSLSHTAATSTPNGTVGNGNNTNTGSNYSSGSRKSVVSGQPTGGKSTLAGGFHCSARRCSSSGLVGGAAACCTSTRSSVSSGYYSKGGFDDNSCLSDVWSISDDGHHLDFSSEFRPPPPPSTNGNSNNSNMRTTRAGGLQAAAAAAAGVRSGSPSLNFAGNGVGCGDTSSTASSTPPSTPRRYNRRVQLRPIKMTDSDEVNALLRQIMETNSQAINFDPREMHMAVQRELRLRNRTVNTGGTISSGSTSLSGCCSSSLGYSSEFSSVENGSVEGNPPLTPSPSTAAASAAPSTTQRGRRS